MARDIRTKAHLQGGEIRTKANFGQTVTITVLPDPYEGQTTVTPSDERQTLPTRGKTVATDITVLPAPTESLATSENGTFLPSSGNVGFSKVTVNVPETVPDLRSLSVTANGSYDPDGFDGYDHISVSVPIPAPVLDSLSVTQNGTYTPEAGVDGFDEVNVNVEEQWDGELVPDENDTGFFHCRVINLLSTDTLVIDGYGTGYRWVSTKSNQPTFVYWGAQFGTGAETADTVHCCIYLVPTGDTTVVIGGPAWGGDGAVYTGNYSFKGDYMRYKVIHAS